jgi:hypothetical protein
MSRESSLDNYGGKDLSILAEHLTEGHTIDYLAFSQEPYSIVWSIRNDGVMLGLTYKKEHDVWGWHHHTTNGLFECVTSVSEGNRDVPYVITNRTIGGNTVRFVERMEAREEKIPKNCFYVDCGLSYSGMPTSVISGLNHLNGESVSVLSDGDEVTGLTVQDGKITLPSEATKVHVGLGYTARMTSLPIESAHNVITGATKAVSDVSVLVENSRGAMIGMESLGDEAMVEIKSRRESDSYNTLALYTGFYKLAVYSDWDELPKMSIKQSSPLPLAVLTVVPEVDVGD